MANNEKGIKKLVNFSDKPRFISIGLSGLRLNQRIRDPITEKNMPVIILLNLSFFMNMKERMVTAKPIKATTAPTTVKENMVILNNLLSASSCGHRVMISNNHLTINFGMPAPNGLR